MQRQDEEAPRKQCVREQSERVFFLGNGKRMTNRAEVQRAHGSRVARECEVIKFSKADKLSMPLQC